ncbi:UPF0561 protein C2orf68 homolog isoform X1 [Polyodon spathula]|uniref:UPF0561 protein C2orf68 homolog isoform X1 n=1 Tax=Polyodon spathula TaxID=7913 RepID=UPI001B7EA81B|nr:UPF0561 protein C2orf68 homolog isoform X1 [Polyodon spathula]
MEVLREEEAAMGPEFDHQTKFKPRGRLDMKHGFLHHIRRNQIARDDYDKEVKQAKEKQRKRHTTTATPTRPRRPDIQVYHPRRRSGPETSPGLENEEWNESSSSTDPDQQGTELFCLEYEADGGEVTSFIVHKARHAANPELQCLRTTQLWASYRQALKHPAKLVHGEPRTPWPT